jgi:pimeloyl-ACP methyl ester carboxylesterase
MALRDAENIEREPMTGFIARPLGDKFIIMSSTLHRVETSLGALAFSDQGSGPPLLLFHANPGDHRDFEAVIGPLAGTHRVLAVDWPGYGDAPAPVPPSSASAMSFAAMAVELADRLDLQRVVAIGNSVGGYASVRLALQRPRRVAGLVLVDAGGFTRPTPLVRAFTWLKGREAVTRAVAGVLARRYLRARNGHVRAILARTEAGRRDPVRVAVDAAVWRSFLDPRHDLRSQAGDLRLPVLLAWGRHDPLLTVADASRARAAIPGAELALFDTGHMPFAEDPQRFLEVVRPFLARVAAGQGAA